MQTLDLKLNNSKWQKVIVFDKYFYPEKDQHIIGFIFDPSLITENDRKLLQEYEYGLLDWSTGFHSRPNIKLPNYITQILITTKEFKENGYNLKQTDK